MRYYIFLALLLLCSLPLTGQVNADITFDKSRGQIESRILVNWPESEEAKWKQDNLPRLEIMAIKCDLLSRALPVSNFDVSVYSFLLPKNDQIEILLEIEEMAADEVLAVIDAATGRTIFSSVNHQGKKILLPVVGSENIRLEWRNNLDTNYTSQFSIRNIYVHESSDRVGRGIGFDTALPCIPNAACKQDSIMQLISKSSVRIRMVMDEGIGWCSGSFINNTRNDKTPYILSAYHCTFEYTPQYELWRFDIAYRTDSCSNPSSEPNYYSLTGCERRAGRQESDFLLLELQDDPPTNYELTFAGWKKDETNTPDTSYLFHHPNADVRKISTCTNKAIVHPNQIGWSEGYTTPANQHFRFKFTEGGHQPGSSGGPVFNQDGYLIGQLHGGISGCESLNVAYTGRLSKSWDQGASAEFRLKDWLDPDNTGVSQIDALPNFGPSDMTEINGRLVDPTGRPIRNVAIIISGALSDTVMTNEDGQFFISNVNRNGQYHLVPSKDDYQTNGLNVLDLISIQKHLLAKDTFNFSWQHVAADATNNDNLSVGDILVLLRLLLGKVTHLPSSPSWRFDPPFIDINTIPAGEPMQVQMTGIKIGDLNGSVDPGL